MLDVALLGTGGMMPLPNRFLTSLLLRFNGRLLMVDCGEATQITLKLLGWSYKNLDIICITHFHADHIAGLPGLLLTVGNAGRDETLTLIGPPGLMGVAKSLCVIAQELPFDIDVIELPFERGFPPETVTLGKYSISAYPLDHRIPCFAYSFVFNRAGKFDTEKAKENDVPLGLWNKLQNGESIQKDGRLFTPDMVLGTARQPIKASYCTDTRPVKGLGNFVKDSDLFICEGLYGEPDKQHTAKKHKHMTFQEAAKIAREGDVKELWLTHFSPAMPAPDAFIEYARSIFPNSKVGRDRKTKTLNYSDD
ncbi:MAG: ribonuclease Z [Clostridiales bacterium]|nr:ribonuclease Z [Clostridiales bacterium]